MKRMAIAALLTLAMVSGALAGCGNNTETGQQGSTNENTNNNETVNTSPESDLSGTLVFSLYDGTELEVLENLDLESKFQEQYPNANIEYEKIKDDSEYWNTMKIRASANQLPDIMHNKTFTLSRFQDYLVDLTDTQAAANNEIAEGYAINGTILGIPEKMTAEYVYYWKDMFEEAGVTVPTTWEQFEDVSKKLQEFYGADNKDFSAIAIGGKDEWPTYPFSEFMPALESGNGKNWNTMASMDEPFAEGTDFYNSYQKIYSLFQSGVFGKDPLGIGSDQATSLFVAKQAAMTASGGWALATFKEDAEDIENLGTFYLPTRNSESDPFRTIIQGDNFMSVTKHSKNQELAKAFVEFFFSDAWYPEYINTITDDNTMKNVTKEKAPILAEADALQPDKELVMYDGGGDDFTALQAETAFDYKKLGAQMLIEGYDLDGALAALNENWKGARGKLGIQ